MCRNIKTLFNFDPPATDEEIHAASVQFVRKLSGFTNPSKANEAAFDDAVEDVAKIARRLIDNLVTDIAVTDFDAASPGTKRIADQMRRSLTEDMLAQYVQRLQTDIGATINLEALRRVSSGGTDQN